MTCASGDSLLHINMQDQTLQEAKSEEGNVEAAADELDINMQDQTLQAEAKSEEGNVEATAEATPRLRALRRAMVISLRKRSWFLRRYYAYRRAMVISLRKGRGSGDDIVHTEGQW